MAQEPDTTEGAARPAGGEGGARGTPQELTELSVLKALAQPRRQQVLQHLTVHGPATSAGLARALGLNTGATSYHLRELARYGFVEETERRDAGEAREGGEPGGMRGGGERGRTRGGEGPGGTRDRADPGRKAASRVGRDRERWWRAVPGDRRFPPRSRQSPEVRLVMDELNRHAYAADLELFERLQRDADPAELGEWADAFPYSRGTIRLTPLELRAFFEEYIALLNRYKRPDTETPDGARTVLTRFLAFPAPPPPTAATGAPEGNRDNTDNRRETELS